MLEILKYIFLGFVQGITEALPISSSGHLLISKSLVDVGVDFDTLAIITNFGSLIAVIFIFRNDIIKLIKGFFKYLFNNENESKNEFKYCILLIIGCIPAGIVGLIIKKLDLLNKMEENVKFVGISLLITAVLLYIIKDFDGKLKAKNMGIKGALSIGSFQILGLLPGISRSGSTIVGGMMKGLSRDEAFKYSFLLYIPMSLAATALEIKDLIGVNISSTLWIYYLISTVVAFIFTALFIKWFRKIVNEGKLIWFVYYCLIVGTLVILFL